MALQTAKSHFGDIRRIGGAFLSILSQQTFTSDDFQIRFRILTCRDTFEQTYGMPTYLCKRFHSFVEKTITLMVKEVQKDTKNGIDNFAKWMLSAVGDAIYTLAKDCRKNDIMASIHLYYCMFGKSLCYTLHNNKNYGIS